jgi:hypothetical protein
MPIQCAGRGTPPALPIGDQASVTIGIMHPVAVDQVECRGLANRPATPGAKVRRQALAVFHVSAPFRLAPGQSLRLIATVATVILPDRRSLRVNIAPPSRVRLATRVDNPLIRQALTSLAIAIPAMAITI